MASIVGFNDLSISLIDAGNRLLKPPSSTEELLALLNETESLLRDVGQAQPLSMQHALTPSKNALVSSELLNHPDSDVRVSLVSCLTEIVRITSPQAPYGDDQMKEIFRLTVETFEKLADGKAEFVLDTVSRLNSCLVMLDLECDDLILQMFRIFFKTIRSDHPWVVPSSMEMIMITVIDETDEVSKDLLDTLLTTVKKENQNVSPVSWSLAEKVLSRCARKLQPYIVKAFKSTGTSLDLYSPVVSSICQTVFVTPKVHNAVNTKENEDKLGDSKRPAREGTRRISGNDEVRKGRKSSSLSKHSLKQEVKSEGIDGETDLRITGKRGRKPNSLMNPEEGYDISWLSGKKVAAKKTPPALTGSVKRRRVSIGESDHDSDEEANQESYEVSEDERKIRNSSKKKKKPMVVNSSGKRSSARSDTKKKKCYTDDFGESLVGKRVNIWWPLDKTFYEGVIESYCSRKKMHRVAYSEGDQEQLNLVKERWELLEDPSSASEKKVSQVGARPLAEESEETSKSQSTRSQTARKEVGSDTNGSVEDLVGKRVNIWWPLDKTFYEGVVESYSSRKKMHKVVYTDGESEQLNLVNERWELLEDLSSASEQDMEIDLPESIPLFDIMQRQKKVKKSKKVESSKKDSGKKAREGKNLKSLKELSAAETDRREEEQGMSRDVDEESEDEYYNSEMQESEENLKVTETEGKEEEEQFENPEVESEGDGSESEEEPKWRETDDMEDEAEERERG